MDYTTTALVKAAMGSQESVADSVLADYVTRASRLIDRLCTGIAGVNDYFKSETITGEVLTNGVIDFEGRLSFYPHKPVITAVTALAWRPSLRNGWVNLDTTYISIEQDSVVCEALLNYTEHPHVQVTYTGGLAASQAALPADFVDVATVMAVRLYKEARSGLADSIGVAELGTLIYTKAFPVRVLETLEHYNRIAPWT